MVDTKKTSRSIAANNNRIKKSTPTNTVTTKLKNQLILKSGRSKWIISFIILSAVILIFGYLGYKNFILAWVDNTPVTKLSLYSELEDKFGKEYTEQLISKLLIEKEAKAKGIAISEIDIDQEIKKTEQQEGGSEQLKQSLELQGMTMKELRDQTKYQLMIEGLFGKDKTVTDQEVKDYWQKERGQSLSIDTLPVTESAKVKEDIKKTLLNEKISKDFQEWLSNNQKSERVKRLIYQ